MNGKFVSKDRRELAQYLGHMRQLAGIRRMTLDDGRGRGCRLAEVDNGSGLAFVVNCDRAMDILDFRYRGVPLAWISRNGVVHPHAYEPEGLAWLRSYTGGLLTTCGLRNVGGPNEYNDEKHGLHGRISHLEAENVNSAEEWRGNDYVLEVQGVVRESRVFGENLVLRRRIWTCLGTNTVAIEDEITNEAATPSPFMMLYHMNFGYPLVSSSTVLETVAHRITPASPVAEEGLGKCASFEAPKLGYAEQVFWHEIPGDQAGYASATLKNPALGLGLRVSYNVKELPYLVEWKQLGFGDYVVGLEPANCFPVGQAKFAEMGKLRQLEPGEVVRHRVVLEVIEL